MAAVESVCVANAIAAVVALGYALPYNDASGAGSGAAIPAATAPRVTGLRDA
jgi:hypothetical protein